MEARKDEHDPGGLGQQPMTGSLRSRNWRRALSLRSSLSGAAGASSVIGKTLADRFSDPRAATF